MTTFNRMVASGVVSMLLVSTADCKRLVELTTEASKEVVPAKTASAPSDLVDSTTSTPKAGPETPCWMLTAAEVASVLKLQTVATKLPKAGEYGAPRCQWAPLMDASNPPSVVIAYFGDQGKDVDKYFDQHLDIDTKTFKAFHEPIAGLGDRAMLFGARMWVKKGDAFFSLTASGVDWSSLQIAPREAQVKLARLALAHMR